MFFVFYFSSWSEEGCRVASYNITHVRCQCEHLTNFAVLMDFHATPLPPTHSLALAVITYVGCVVSIVCLLLAIVVFHVFKGLKVNWMVSLQINSEKYKCVFMKGFFCV